MCGVVGVVLPDRGHEAAAAAATALFALQHRGQESAGVGVSDGRNLMIYKDLGMVSQVLDERRIPSLAGDLAVAHCRYSTTGSTVWENAQPTLRLGPRRALAIGHNGNLVNTRELLDQLEGGRGRLAASTDTELLTALLADEPAVDTVDALRQGPAAGPRRVQPRDPRRAQGHRRPRPARLPAARPGPAADPQRRRRRPGPVGRRHGRLDPRLGDGGARHRRRGVRAGRRAGRDRRARAGPRARLGPLRGRHARAVRVRAHLLRPPGLVHGGPQPVRGAAAHGDAAGDRAPRRRRRPRDARARHGRAGRRGLRRGIRAPRIARAWSATATAAGRSSSRRRRCASGAST